jgi:hypothetical protein
MDLPNPNKKKRVGEDTFLFPKIHSSNPPCKGREGCFYFKELSCRYSFAEIIRIHHQATGADMAD